MFNQETMHEIFFSRFYYACLSLEYHTLQSCGKHPFKNINISGGIP